MSIRIFEDSELYSSVKLKSFPAQSNYLGMYSSWLGGICTNPFFMQVPIDDHMVHRGDGIFEAIKTYQGKVVLFQEHWQRLQRSASMVSLPMPIGFEDLKEIFKALYPLAKGADVLYRVFLSRGPGGFTTNPYETIGTQVYVVMTRFQPYSAEKYQKGVSTKRSLVPVKDSWLAQAKTCNYLHNVMMKKEAVDSKVDFVLGFDEKNQLAESSTENVIIITTQNEIVHPQLDRILNGCTMKKIFELAPALGLRPSIRAISEKDIYEAQEVMMAGTTLDVLPVTSYEGHPIGTGQPGLFAQNLRTRLIGTQLNSDFDLNLF